MTFKGSDRGRRLLVNTGVNHGLFHSQAYHTLLQKSVRFLFLKEVSCSSVLQVFDQTKGIQWNKFNFKNKTINMGSEQHEGEWIMTRLY